jgi:HPt (histidine-containing phosphotransfer) domain-containing protein
MTAIDRQVFAELQATTGADFVVELVGSFLQDAPDNLAALRRARVDGQAAEFRRQAHSLKSNGVTFGALAFAEQARHLEQTALPDLGDAAAEVERLVALFEAAALELKGLCHA